MVGSAGGDEEVGKWETLTPQPIICGTQVNVGGASQGDITDPEIGRKITELADQLKVQCLRETAVILWHLMYGLASYDISAACSYVILAKGKEVVQTRFAVSLPSRVYARMAPRSGLTVKKFIDMAVGVIDSD